MRNGARFYKCDLHMQTPADGPRWLGQPMGVDPANEDATAEMYLRRCQLAGLELIAVTDHNFASKTFILALRKAAKRLSNEFEREIVIFPGFEIQADVGRGMHVVCVFNPNSNLEEVDHVLTQCGIPVQRFVNNSPASSTCRLSEILEAVQQKRDSRYCGIVICPHSQADAGIFDTDRIAEWLQAEEFKNPDLLCLEVPKPIERMSAGWQRLFRSDDDCDPIWRRSRPIAAIMSSDAKALHPSEAPNFIGLRHTWIKLGEPTVEGLRHAFLAHESRIRLSEPKLPTSHVVAMEVGACKFFVDKPFNVTLNCQFNALIGGRGTGKSTILEYLRWGLCDQPVESSSDDPLSAELPAYVKKRASLIEGTLKNQPPDKAYVRVTCVINDTVHIVTRFVNPERLTLQIGSGSVQNATESDIRRLLPMQAYSQKQLSTVAVRTVELRRLVEAPLQVEVRSLNERIETQRAAIRSFYEAFWRAKSIDEQIRANEAEVTSLKSQVDSLKQQLGSLSPADKRTLDDHERYVGEDQLIHRVESDVSGMAESLAVMQETVRALPRDAAVPLGSPQRELLSRVVELGLRAKSALGELVSVATATITEVQDEIQRERYTWQTSFETHKEAYTSATNRAAAYKSQLKEIDLLTRRINDLQKLVDGLRAQRNAMTFQPDEEQRQISTWVKLHKERGDTLETACEKLTALSQGDIRAELIRGGDADSAVSLLRERVAGARVRGEWLDKLRDQVTSASNPAEEWMKLLSEIRLLADIPNEQAGSVVLPDCPRLSRAGFSETSLRGIATRILPSDWLDLMLTSLSDRPKFFYRVDRSQEIPFEAASLGQQATALLTTLLNQGGGPLLIDQPEDDLDNAIISRVVETIWVAKERRQLIFASHNANLVVNGDAELVMHCDYKSADNKSVGHISSAGSIDEKNVCEAIKSVMEGGAKAFELRKAKYGF